MKEQYEPQVGVRAAAALHTEKDGKEKWLAAFDTMLELARKYHGDTTAANLVVQLAERLNASGVAVRGPVTTPYLNTIPVEQQPPYPGDLAMERRVKSYIRWNAMAMVVNANRQHSGIGGHISTYASCATLYEVGFNHFFRARTDSFAGDLVYFQGHAAPGIYARAFLEGRLSEQHLHNFRQELAQGGGLSSYPHPYLMPDFWQFPTVSMGRIITHTGRSHRALNRPDAPCILRV